MNLLKIALFFALAMMAAAFYFRQNDLIVEFDGSGFYSTSIEGLRKNLIEISFEFKTSKLDQIIIFSEGIPEKVVSGKFLFKFSLVNGKPVLKRAVLTNGSVSNAVELNSKKILSDGQFHKIVFTIEPKSMSLNIDGIRSVQYFDETEDAFVFGDSIFVGGNSDVRDKQLMVGTLKNLKFGYEEKTLTFHRAQKPPKTEIPYSFIN